MTPQPGIYREVMYQDYADWDCVNSGILRALDHAPAMARYRKDHPEPDRKPYALGRLFHLLSTQPELAEAEFATKPLTYFANGKKKDDELVEKPWNMNATACKEWVAELESKGFTVVSRTEWLDATAMAGAVRTHPKVGPLIIGADPEVSVVWDDPQTGLRCKARFDCLNATGIMADLKSCQMAKPEPFWAEAVRHGYDIQAALYIDAQKIVFPVAEVPWFVFVAVEKYPPYLVRCYDVRDDPDAQSFEFLSYGRQHYRTLLQEYAFCKEHNSWPGYPVEHQDMMLPNWAKRQDAWEIK